MPGLDGLEATRRLLESTRRRAARGAPRIVILTTFDLDEYVYAALQAGACGFLLKDVSPEQLVACRPARRGRRCAAGAVDHPAARRAVRASRPAPRPSPREALGAADRPRDGGAPAPRPRHEQRRDRRSSWSVSEATVKTHVAAILAKLGLRNRARRSCSPTSPGWSGRATEAPVGG